MINEIFICASRNRKLTVGIIMTKLIDIGIGFIRDPFTVAVNIETGKGSSFNGVFGYIPDLVQNGVRTYECTILILK